MSYIRSVWDARTVKNDHSMPFGNNLHDPELPPMFQKFRELENRYIHCVKPLLEAYLFKNELKEKLA